MGWILSFVLWGLFALPVFASLVYFVLGIAQGVKANHENDVERKKGAVKVIAISLITLSLSLFLLMWLLP